MCAGCAGLPGIGKLLQEICEGLCGNCQATKQPDEERQGLHVGTEEEAAFKKLKEALTSAPILQVFDKDKPHEVWVDVSGYAVGATLV